MSEPTGLPWLEIAANAVNLTSIVLAGRNRVATWWTGIFGCLLFGALFFSSRLYADVTLQGFFIVTGVVGWVRWSHTRSGKTLTIRRTPLLRLLAAALAAVVVTVAYGTFLHATTDAYAPYADSVVLAFSVVAQFLLMGRRLESWYFWLVVNTVAVPLYFSRGLTLTAVLYVGFWINAIVALFHWRKELLAQTARRRLDAT